MTASDQFERDVARFVIAARSYASLSVVADTLVGARRFKRPGFARASAATVALHGVWPTRRGFARGRIDDRLLGVTDLMLSAALLAGDAVARGDRYRHPGPQPATDYVGVASGLSAVQLHGGAGFSVGFGGLLAALVGTTTGAAGDGRSAGLTQLLADVLLACEGAATLSLVRQLRELAKDLDEAPEHGRARARRDWVANANGAASIGCFTTRRCSCSRRLAGTGMSTSRRSESA